MLFKVRAILSKNIRLTNERWKYISFKHPEIARHIEEVKDTLREPNKIRKSRYDPKVWLYYKFFKELRKYLTVVVKILNEDGFVVTAYLTDRIKLGEEIWKEK